eukprot:CAMPEP_0178709322 /NCGR_PEP_ID=MMETSP0699-20121125/17158_1 /TAXON_ID=265572 /ORGANISM="Extubocellulus spinifer, Strain CCMP396" /LENGTH=512 /DNA_ID=CAMNT_0020357741 /DNA_START=263 /DNA_END=1799 /DNA_ORIENTATION=-
MALTRQKELCNSDSLPITHFPMRDERMDLFAVRHPYDYVTEAIEADNPEFAFNASVRNDLLHLKFNQHAHKHRMSCFKKGNECRAHFPQGLQPSWGIEWEDSNEVDWDMVDGSPRRVCAFSVLPERTFGDQYMNTHNRIISNLIACNNNVQIGDIAHLFYNTLYTGKDTQRDDAQKWIDVSTSFSKCIVREARRRQQEQEASDGIDGVDTDEEPDFLRGLSRLMSGVRSHMATTTISATMAHLLSTRGGSRFHFSHDTQGLPISQLEALCKKKTTNQEASGEEETGEEPDFLRGLSRLMDGVRSHMSSTTISATMAHLLSTRGGSRFHLSHDTQGLPISQLEALEAGEDITYYYRRSKAPDSETVEPWPESFADNYLLRPDALEDCCSYCMVMNYAIVQAGSKKSERSQKYKGDKLYFQEEHPSKRRSHVRELKHIQVPLVYTKKDMPSISELEIDSSTPSNNAEMLREYYAKLSLFLLYPFRDFSELRHEDGTFWSKYIWAKQNGKLWSFD